MNYFANLGGWKTSYSTNHGHLFGRTTTTGQTNANYALIEANNNANLTYVMINEKMQEIALRQSIAKEEAANALAGTTTANTNNTPVLLQMLRTILPLLFMMIRLKFKI